MDVKRRANGTLNANMRSKVISNKWRFIIVSALNTMYSKEEHARKIDAVETKDIDEENFCCDL